MKKWMPTSLLFIITFLSCASKKNFSKTPFTPHIQHFVVFPFRVEPSSAKVSEKTVTSLQNAYIIQIAQTDNTVTDSITLLNQIKDLNLPKDNLGNVHITIIGKTLPTDIDIWGTINYRTDPELDKTDPEFKLEKNAFDIKTGTIIWQQQTVELFDLNTSS